jgi:hypothetical protein
MESALEQNIIFDAFENDWLDLGAEISSIGSRGDVHLKVNFEAILHSILC